MIKLDPFGINCTYYDQKGVIHEKITDAAKIVLLDPRHGENVEITDPSLVGFLAFANLSSVLQEAPQITTPGYEIVRYWPNGPFDHFHAGLDSARRFVSSVGGDRVLEFCVLCSSTGLEKGQAWGRESNSITWIDSNVFMMNVTVPVAIHQRRT